MNFFDTRAGHRFTNQTIPELSKELKRFNDNIELFIKKSDRENEALELVISQLKCLVNDRKSFVEEDADENDMFVRDIKALEIAIKYLQG